MKTAQLFIFIFKSSHLDQRGRKESSWEYSAHLPPLGCSAAPFALIYLRRCVQTLLPPLQTQVRHRPSRLFSRPESLSLVQTALRSSAWRKQRDVTERPPRSQDCSDPHPTPHSSLSPHFFFNKHSWKLIVIKSGLIV